MSIETLQDDFKDFNDRKLLFDSFDAFICDDKLIERITRILGKKFKFQKYVVPIRFTKKMILKNVINVRDCVTFYLLPSKRLNVKIGTTSMNPEDIIDNIIEPIDYIVSKIPKKWKNIQSLGIKTTQSIELPFYPSIINEEKEESNEDIKEESNGDISIKEESNEEIEEPQNNYTETIFEETSFEEKSNEEI